MTGEIPLAGGDINVVVRVGELIAHRRARLEQRAWGGVTPREVIVENLRWVEDHHGELATFLA